MYIRSITTIVLVATFALSANAQSGSRGSASAPRAQSFTPSQSFTPQAISPPITAPQQVLPQASVLVPGESQPSFSQPSFSQPSFSQPGVLQPGITQAAPLGQPIYTDPIGAIPSTPSVPMAVGQVVTAPPTNASGSLGVPAASTNDPIWEMNDPASTFTVDHSYLDCFLNRYVSTDSRGLNRVSYGRVTANDRGGLLNYLNYLQSFDVRTLNRNEQLAYWLNLYNARIIALILDHYPLNSVRKIKSNLLDLLGPFDDQLICVLGKKLSLNDVESGIIRPIWGDPRIHYALNCASYGCPNLKRSAWRSSDLDAQLNTAAYQFLNSDRAVKVGAFGRVRVSKIFKWYADDFGGTDQAVLQHIRTYANPATCRKLAKASSISGHFYDWSLNDARKTRGPLLERLVR